jgi:flagellar protein FliO/FliZ
MQMIKSKCSLALSLILFLFQFSIGLCQNESIEDSVHFSPSEQFSENPDYDENFFLAEASSVNQVNEPDNFQAKFLNMLFILGLLIGFMVLASWMLKKMMKSRVTQINQASSIKILETRQLSPKSALYLIEVEGKIILIGESQTMINHIASFPEPIDSTQFPSIK